VTVTSLPVRRIGVGALIALGLLALAGCARDDGPETPMFVVDPDAQGPLTLEELQVSFDNEVGRQLSSREKECVLREVAERAFSAGDPEALDPATVEFIPIDQWGDLDAHGRRIILAQVILTKSFFEC
jgi:type IV pilus biogenesis protein CpaD/CtpE